MKKFLAILAFLSAACCHAPAATLNPSASKAYVDKKIAEVNAVIEKKTVFTNTLQVVSNIYYNVYTNTYVTNVYNSVYNVTTNTKYNVTSNFYNVTYKTNVTVQVYDTTNITNNVYNTYTNTYQTNVTVEVQETTNITTEVHNTTNLDVYVTNTVNVVTNDIVFADTVYYTNMAYAVVGYTGVVIRAVSESGDPLVTTTNSITFYPRSDIANCYTNGEYGLYYRIGSGDGEDRGYYMCLDGQSFLGSKDTWDELGLTTSFEGDSFADATSMTLVYTDDGMYASPAFILGRAPVGSTVRDVRAIRYNQTMAAEFSVESRRLVSEDGLQWLDSTGVWWQVTAKHECPSYFVAGETLLSVPSAPDTQPWHFASYESESWEILCSDNGEGYSPRYNYTLMGKNGAVSRDAYSDTYPEQEIAFTSYEALYFTAVTNGVVYTNAVRRVVFRDGLSSGDVMSRFDDASVTTNEFRELEVKGFSTADTLDIPYKNGESLEWGDAETILWFVQRDLARHSTWGYYGGILYNCYVQVGSQVLKPDGSGVSDASIYVSSLSDGAYGVGYRYTPSTGVTVVTFGLLTTLNSGTYDAVVYVGTLFHESGVQKWGGIASIPIIFIFE